MAKTKFDYFQAFSKMANYASDSAAILKKTLEDYTALDTYISAVKDVERAADKLHHEMLSELSRAFITPIESEDIKEIAENIDDIIDQIDTLVSCFNTYQVANIRAEAAEFAVLIGEACDIIVKVFADFENFKKSKNIASDLIEIKETETKGDLLYHKSLNRLFTEKTDVLEILKWSNVFDYMENCCDLCENLANKAERVILKNT